MTDQVELAGSPRVDFEDVTVVRELPPLAWALSVATGKLTVGTGVEVDGGTCFEGARAGDLIDRDGDSYVFGSGVVREEHGYTVIPPTHTLDGVYMTVRHKGGATVTNSLVWALRMAGVTKQHARQFTPMTQAIRTATQGILGYKRLILPLRDFTVFQFLYAPFGVDAHGVAERPVSFPVATRFDFATYKARVVDVIRATTQYSDRFGRLLSTCSSGYDSPACTALGKEVGLEMALTVNTGRGGRDDSGERPATEMGVPVKVFERPGNGHEWFSERVKDWFIDLGTVAQATGEDFSEFIATFANHGDVYFKPFEEHLRGAVLLTGFHGAIWDYWNNTGPWVRRGDTSGSGINEYRLRVGFVHLPAPYILARETIAIQRLSHSDEMRPWLHGNPYNRPIPRRLGEEAGASRESFGIRKRAANVMIECSNETVADSYERVADRYV